VAPARSAARNLSDGGGGAVWRRVSLRWLRQIGSKRGRSAHLQFARSAGRHTGLAMAAGTWCGVPLTSQPLRAVCRRGVVRVDAKRDVGRAVCGRAERDVACGEAATTRRGVWGRVERDVSCGVSNGTWCVGIWRKRQTRERDVPCGGRATNATTDVVSGARSGDAGRTGRVTWGCDRHGRNLCSQCEQGRNFGGGGQTFWPEFILVGELVPADQT
jgi:hypothetical protein